MTTIKSKNDNQNNYDYTDMENMKRFVNQHKDTLKSTGSSRSWFVWDGKRWRYEADDVTAIQRGFMTIESIDKEASITLDGLKRQELLKWSKSSHSKSRILSMISMASKHKDMIVSMADFDKDLHVINCLNGVVDLTNRSIQASSSHRLISKLANASYNPRATASVFKRFINQIFGNDIELIRWVQRAIGYSFTGSVVEQKLFIAYGTGANGKSTLFEIIKLILGDYSKTADFETFLSKQKSGVRELEAVGELKGIRFALASETDSHVRFSEAIIKRLTGGDTLRGTKLMKSAFEFKPEFKLCFLTNHLPYAKDGSFGFWRRIKVVPFNQRFSGSKVDSTLYNQLLKEKDGILKWCIDGAYHWHDQIQKSGGKTGLGPCKAIDEATEDYKSENDVLSHFINYTVEVEVGSQVEARDLYNAYTIWANDNTSDDHTNPISETFFGKRMVERGLKKTRVSKGYIYVDIKLKNNGSCYNI
ncbi:phage/plasmid primase, P4 family [Alphaproteobacteria bacterium]|nr:phage/plasmid primase, P4 family [Alphaproteobacteria bacterium]